MDEKGLVRGIRDYMIRLHDEGRFSTAKSYQDALNSFVRYRDTEPALDVTINKESLRHSFAMALKEQDVSI